MVLLPCSKCCGPCWRCYRKSTLQMCNNYDFAFRVTVAEVVSEPSPPTGGITSPVIFDTSEETGIPIGAELLLSEPDWGSTCKWSLQYTAPEQIACRVDNSGNPIGFPGLSNASVRITLSADRPPDPGGKVSLFLSSQPQDTTTFGGKPSGDWPWPTKNDNCSVFDYNNIFGLRPDAPPITEPGEYIWRVPITYKSSSQPGETLVGNIGFKIEVFSKGDIPENAYEYQCFDAPPDEEGWLPVGKCHTTEAECALSCPSVPFCECEEPNVLGNELTMTLQDFKDTGYTPTETENITCTPEQLFSQIKAMSFNAPFFDWYKSDGTIFDTATWGPGSDNLLDGMIAEANCVDDLYLPEFSNTIACQLQEDLGTDCLKYFEEENFNVFPSKVEWTPESVMTSMRITQGGTPQRICDFAKTGTTLLEFDKVYSPEPGEGFGVLARWENLNYISDPAYPWPRFKNLYLAKFRTDMLLSINGTPPGGRAMPTTTTGPGTHLKNMLALIGIREKEKGCKCGHWQKKMDKGGPQWCRDHKEEILDHLAKEAKKRGLPFVRLAADKLLDLAIRRAEKYSA